MLSSLIFVALAAAWLIVLVPMFARRRQEVSRTTDTALSARVIRRGGERRSASTGGSSGNKGKEALAMPDSEDKVDPNTPHDDTDGAELDEEFDAPDEEQWRGVRGEEVRSGRRYRPGRGGFDPDAAALAARTKYARRQRIVLAMLVVAVLTALLAGFSWSVLWWFHGIADLSLVGYLGYLRRQVRIEEDVRNRRLARMNGETGRSEDEHPRSEPSRAEASGAEEGAEDSADAEPRWAAGSSRSRNGSGVEVLDIDDEDPEFDELDDRLWQPYRRAVGE
ncbi:gephyrin-like molybdotransferase receptor GlpR [Actinopolyspora halophila]|uniref:divisome protein SepX/GlpR n=1 Tax=Actinopolyspora halophila TaxID=1850 RepID=UPI000377C7CD|nr:gephyrin-like molybdotransferase receptor GlpR [Actinopolyspora halophila]